MHRAFSLALVLAAAGALAGCEGNPAGDDGGGGPFAGTYEYSDSHNSTLGISCVSRGKMVIEYTSRTRITGTVKSTGSCSGNYSAGWSSPLTGSVTETAEGAKVEFQMETCRFTSNLIGPSAIGKRLGGSFSCLNAGNVRSGNWAAVK